MEHLMPSLSRYGPPPLSSSSTARWVPICRPAPRFAAGLDGPGEHFRSAEFQPAGLIQEIHEAFLAVGCDAVETNTFGANKIVLAEADMVEPRTRTTCRLQNRPRACDKFETPDRPRYVVGSVGPGTKIALARHDQLGRPARQLPRADARPDRRRGGRAPHRNAAGPARDQMRHHRRQHRDEGAGPARARSWCRRRFDTDNGNQMLTGSDPSALVATFEPYDEVDLLGVNCAFGPTELTETVRYIGENWPRFVSALPNAGLADHGRREEPFPDEPRRLHEGDDALRRRIRREHRRRLLRHHARASEDARRRRRA